MLKRRLSLHFQPTAKWMALASPILALAMALSLLLSPIQASAIVNGQLVNEVDMLGKSTVAVLFGEINRCTAVIIGRRKILLAAHCLDYPLESYKVAFTTDLTPALMGLEKVQLRNLRSAHKHPLFGQRDLYSDDLGVAELDGDIPEGYVVAALPLAPLQLNSLTGRHVLAFGIGLQNKEGIPFPMVKSEQIPNLPWEPVQLRKVEVTLSTPEASQISNIDFTYNRLFTEQLLGGICLGDSGGPVFLISEDKAPLLIAVNGAIVPNKAHSAPCAANAYFTRVDTALDWLHAELTSP